MCRLGPGTGLGLTRVLQRYLGMQGLGFRADGVGFRAFNLLG